MSNLVQQLMEERIESMNPGDSIQLEGIDGTIRTIIKNDDNDFSISGSVLYEDGYTSDYLMEHFNSPVGDVVRGDYTAPQTAVVPENTSGEFNNTPPDAASLSAAPPNNVTTHTPEVNTQTPSGESSTWYGTPNSTLEEIDNYLQTPREYWTAENNTEYYNLIGKAYREGEIDSGELRYLQYEAPKNPSGSSISELLNDYHHDDLAREIAAEELNNGHENIVSFDEGALAAIENGTQIGSNKPIPFSEAGKEGAVGNITVSFENGEPKYTVEYTDGSNRSSFVCSSREELTEKLNYYDSGVSKSSFAGRVIDYANSISGTESPLEADLGDFVHDMDQLKAAINNQVELDTAISSCFQGVNCVESIKLKSSDSDNWPRLENSDLYLAITPTETLGIYDGNNYMGGITTVTGKAKDALKVELDHIDDMGNTLANYINNMRELSNVIDSELTSYIESLAKGKISSYLGLTKDNLAVDVNEYALGKMIDRYINNGFTINLDEKEKLAVSEIMQKLNEEALSYLTPAERFGNALKVGAIGFGTGILEPFEDLYDGAVGLVILGAKGLSLVGIEADTTGLRDYMGRDLTGELGAYLVDSSGLIMDEGAFEIGSSGGEIVGLVLFSEITEGMELVGTGINILQKVGDAYENIPDEVASSASLSETAIAIGDEVYGILVKSHLGETGYLLVDSLGIGVGQGTYSAITSYIQTVVDAKAEGVEISKIGDYYSTLEASFVEGASGDIYQELLKGGTYIILDSIK